VEAELACAEAAIGRYLRAFESARMPEHGCGPRVENWPTARPNCAVGAPSSAG
jgi:hypothetical protein